MRIPQLPLAALATALLITGCSSSSDSTSANNDASLSGKVADGYLAGARVCLDLNENGACDDGEPSTISASGGAFTLQDVTQEQIDSFPLVVEIIVGETIDEDTPGEAITRAYTLTAPAGSVFVSPLTTLIQNEIQESGLSAEEAIASIQARLGTDIDPSADYVAGSGGDESADEYERLYRIAQLTRAVMQENQALIDDIAGETELDPADLLAIIVGQVLDALDDIQTAVENAGEDFDPDALVQNGSVGGAILDESDIEEQIEQREDINNATSANLATAVATGLFYFEEDDQYFNYGAVETDGDSIAETYFGYGQTEQSFPNYVWSPVDYFEGAENCYLTASGWECVSEETETITASGNNLRILQGDLAVTEEIVTGITVDLEGKRLATYLPGYEKVLAPRETFSAGATAYRLTFTRTNTLYRLFKSAPDSFEGLALCPSEGSVGTDPYDFTDDDWCNNVFSATSGEEPLEGEGAPLTTLASMISATPLEDPDSIWEFVFRVEGDPSEEFESGVWNVELLADGTANYWTSGLIAETQEYGFYIAHVSTWSYQTVNNQQLLVLNFPAAVKAQGNFDDEIQGYVFAVVDGYVRRGDILKSGALSDQDWAFNETARDDILEAFNYEIRYDLEPNTEYDAEEVTVGQFEEFVYDMNAAFFEENNVALAGFRFANTDGVFTLNAGETNTAGTGTYVGLIDDERQTTLQLTWALETLTYVEEYEGESNEIDFEVLVINASETIGGVTTYYRLTGALNEANARQLSFVLFSQEAATLEALDTAEGEVNGEVWDIR